jgi:hypothetical protein
MSQPELLKKVITVLETIDIDYMMTGSIVSSLQGEPRSTHDIDCVIALGKPVVDTFVKAFAKSKFYLDRDAIIDAIERQGSFNMLDTKEGDKVDFWLLTDDEFDKSRFSRRYVENVLGITMYVSSPEDTILMKLKWALLSGGSEKQFIDALRVYEVQCENLDGEYIESWVQNLALQSLWQRLKEEAKAL